MSNLADRHAARVLKLTDTMARTSLALQEWRSEAGPKGEWSNHIRLKEGASFAATEAAAAGLTDLMQEVLPAHWEMGDWVFKPLRMGGSLRWAGKGGRARGGFTVSTEGATLSHLIGVVLGMIEAAGTMSDDDRARLCSLGLPDAELITFSLQTHRCFHEVRATSPRDAWAKLKISGEDNMPHLNRGRITPDEAYALGAEAGMCCVTGSDTWSAAPTLRTALHANKSVRKLCGRPRKISAIRPPWENFDFAAYDSALAAAIRIADSLGTPKGVIGAYLLQECGHWGVGTCGWCGSSAILYRMVQIFEKGEMPQGMDAWQVFALADECGGAARDLVRTRGSEAA